MSMLNIPGMPGTGMSGTGKPGTGMPGTGKPGTGMSGTGKPGTGMSGTGMSGTGMSGTGTSGTGMSGTGTSGTGNVWYWYVWYWYFTFSPYFDNNFDEIVNKDDKQLIELNDSTHNKLFKLMICSHCKHIGRNRELVDKKRFVRKYESVRKCIGDIIVMGINFNQYFRRKN